MLVRLRLALRPAGFRGARGALVVAAKAAAFLALAAGIAWLVHRGFREADAATRAVRLENLFFLVYASWVVAPLLGLVRDPFGEASRIAGYPVGTPTVFAHTLLGGLGSGMLLVAVPALVAAVLALPGSTGDAVARLALVALLVLQGAVLQPALGGLFATLVTRRRRQDLTVVLLSLLAVVVFLAARGGVGPKTAGISVLDRAPPAIAGLFPSAWVAGAALDLGRELPLRTLNAVAATLGVSALLAAILARVLRHALRGEAGPGTPEAPRPRRRRRPARTILGAHPLAVTATKELRLVLREPMVKAQLLAQLGFLLVPTMLTLLAVRGADAGPPEYLPDLILTGFGFTVVVVESFLLLNLFGLDGTGFRHLLALPVRRRDHLVHKNAFYFALFGAVNAALLIGLAILAGSVAGWPAGRIALAALRAILLDWTLLALVLSAGNVTSIVFPVRLGTSGSGARGGGAAGAESLGRLAARAAATSAVVLLLAPVALLLLVSANRPLVAALAVPLTLALVAGAWVTSLALAERLLRRRSAAMADHFCAGV